MLDDLPGNLWKYLCCAILSQGCQTHPNSGSILDSSGFYSCVAPTPLNCVALTLDRSRLKPSVVSKGRSGDQSGELDMEAQKIGSAENQMPRVQFLYIYNMFAYVCCIWLVSPGK